MDRYLASGLRRWDTEEARLGIEIDLRVICYWLSRTPEIESVANEVGIPEGTDVSAWRLSAVYGLFWGRGRSTRNVHLRMRHPFNEFPPLERLLVIDTLEEDRRRVFVEDPDWAKSASESLSRGLLVTLVASELDSSALSDALGFLICNPVEGGYMRSYARLQGVRHAGGHIEADLELPEAVQ
jgi:hypothetical protein